MSEVKHTPVLPCPFCGCQPRLCPDNSYGAAMVFCPDINECPVGPVADAELSEGEAVERAIAAWNTRVNSHGDLVEALRYTLGQLWADRHSTQNRASFERDFAEEFAALSKALELGEGL